MKRFYDVFLIVTILSFKDFPFQLQNIPDPPRQLYVLGDPKILFERKIIAIVGTRQITESGNKITAKLTKDFVDIGYIIISGLALGVDGVAHQVAMDCGGKTIAVLGAGVDIIYPMAHADLYKKILNNGAIVSEVPPGQFVPRSKFAARNRIVSGLAGAVLIIECNLRSGSMITAKLALDQGKEIYCVPGSEGTDYLIDQGAKSV